MRMVAPARVLVTAKAPGVALLVTAQALNPMVQVGETVKLLTAEQVEAGVLAAEAASTLQQVGLRLLRRGKAAQVVATVVCLTGRKMGLSFLQWMRVENPFRTQLLCMVVEVEV